MKEYEINTDFGMFEYIALVNSIANEYFDGDEGVYQPHIGMMNTMRLFYNECVVSGKFDEKYGHNVESATDMAEILKDQDFIKEFNSAIMGRQGMWLDFASAYRDAMDIVNTRKSSIGGAVELIGHMIEKIARDVAPLLSSDNIEKVSKIAEDIKNGGASADAIVNAYADIIGGKKNGSKKKNTIPFTKK